MRVVADANVLVSAALARSPQAPSVLTLDAALDGRLELIISPQLLREIAMVLARPRLRRYLSSEEALRFISDLASQSTVMADPPGPDAAVCRDATTTTWSRSRQSAAPTRSWRVISTCSRSTRSSSRSRSSRRASSLIGSADPATSLFRVQTDPAVRRR
jgi:putative PIN family toxin of toxin-antitoxin system